MPNTPIQSIAPALTAKIASDIAASRININNFNSIKTNGTTLINIVHDAIDKYLGDSADNYSENDELYFNKYFTENHPNIYEAIGLVNFFGRIEDFKEDAQYIFDGQDTIPIQYTCNSTVYYPHNIQEYFMAKMTCNPDEHIPGKFDAEIANYENYVIEQLGQHSLDF